MANNDYSDLGFQPVQQQPANVDYSDLGFQPAQTGQVEQNVKPVEPAQVFNPHEQNNNLVNFGVPAALVGLGAYALSRGRDVGALEESVPAITRLFNNNVVTPLQENAQRAITGGIEYVDKTPLKINRLINNIRQLGHNLRYEHQGDMNANKLRGSYAADQIAKLHPDQDMGLYLKRDVINNPNNTPELAGQKLQWLAQNKPELQNAVNFALNPTEEMRQAEAVANGYYKATGEAGDHYGYLPHLLDEESYSNRIYNKPPRNNPQTEVFKNGLSKSTKHAKERFYNDIVEAMQAGKAPSTLKQSELMHIHASEHAKVLANNKLYKALEEHGLGFKAENGRIPNGYSRVGNSNFAVRADVANELRSITQPKTVDFGIFKKVNGVLKANLLSGDFGFHFLSTSRNFAASGLTVSDFVKYGSDKDIRLAFVRAGGMLHNADVGKEVLAELSKDKRPLMQVLSFFGNNPITKKSNELLFGNDGYIANAMVSGWAKDMANWALKHPEATEYEIRSSATSLAEHWNNMGGNPNLTAKGMTANQQEVGQMAMLALKWNSAKVNTVWQMFERTPGGEKARLSAFRGLVGSLIIGNIINNIFTGHNMWENPKGHEFSIQWGADSRVFTPTVLPWQEDVLKLIDKNQEKGIIGGTTQFALGKGSPLVKIGNTAVDISQNASWSGRPIFNESDNPFMKTGKSLGYGVSQNLAIPMSLQGVNRLYQKGDNLPLDYFMAGSTLGQVGKNKEEQDRADYFARKREMKNKRHKHSY